ncbi:hypothetical protein [Polluticaenibacter yanchengensis]|uniref:Uncharacterized protein n=1 Tax=Polluticaenibacter yanchengensis TaxID=3014562 RepID=A0ABT4UL58_9BACT|nr:hypothetical protein [Chitinophagaceae bacterium LY-5]
MKRSVNIETKIWIITTLVFSLGCFKLLSEDWGTITFGYCFWLVPIFLLAMFITIPFFLLLRFATSYLYQFKVKVVTSMIILFLICGLAGWAYSYMIPDFFNNQDEYFFLIAISVAIALIISGIDAYFQVKKSNKELNT